MTTDSLSLSGRILSLGVLLGITLYPLASKAQQPPRFSGVQRSTNGEVALTLDATVGKFYQIDVASELPEWEPLMMLKATAKTTVTDGGAAYLSHRYYRASESAEAAPLTGDFLKTTQGPAVLHPVNHASVVIRWNGLTLYVDPVGAASVYTSIPKADLIVVTHSHGDHFSSTTLDAVRKTDTIILAPQAVFGSLSANLKALTQVMTNGATLQRLGLTVDAVPAYNANHPRGSGNGYVLTLGDRRIYFSGDTEDVLEMRALAQIDVAFVCMNIPFTMSVDKAASAVRQFRPRVIYPYHYRNQDGSFADLNDFKRRVGQDLGIEVRLRAWY